MNREELGEQRQALASQCRRVRERALGGEHLRDRLTHVLVHERDQPRYLPDWLADGP